MKNVAARFVLGLLIAQGLVWGDETTGPIVENISQQAQQNLILGRSYGYYQNVIISKLNEEGNITKQEKRTYQTTWLMDQPYNELLQISDRELNSKEKMAESKRRIDFLKATYTKSKPSGIRQELKTISWWSIHERYDFRLLPSEPGYEYVLSFQPKSGKLPERSRLDRVLNHLAGTVWADADFNVRKAEARLTNPVRFGLGILAKVDEIQVRYLQRRHGQAWLPASLHLLWSANFGLFRHQREQWDVSWYDPYPQPRNIPVSTTLSK